MSDNKIDGAASPHRPVRPSSSSPSARQESPAAPGASVARDAWTTSAAKPSSSSANEQDSHGLTSATTAAGSIFQINTIFALGRGLRRTAQLARTVAKLPASLIKLRPYAQTASVRLSAEAATRTGIQAHVLNGAGHASAELDRRLGWVETNARVFRGDLEAIAQMLKCKFGPMVRALSEVPAVSALGRGVTKLVGFVGRYAPGISAGMALLDIRKALREPCDFNRGYAVTSVLGAASLSLGALAAAVGIGPLGVAAGVLGMVVGVSSFIDTVFNHGRGTSALGRVVDHFFLTRTGTAIAHGLHVTIGRIPLVGDFFLKGAPMVGDFPTLERKRPETATA